VGALRQPALCALVGGSAVALVTPVWEEPFGLVVAEALATGTPVAAFDEGGVPEVLHGLPGTAVVPPGDVDALADAASELARLGQDPAQRRLVRLAAVRRHSLSRRHRDVERVLALTAAPVSVPWPGAPVPSTLTALASHVPVMPTAAAAGSSAAAAQGASVPAPAAAASVRHHGSPPAPHAPAPARRAPVSGR